MYFRFIFCQHCICLYVFFFRALKAECFKIMIKLMSMCMAFILCLKQALHITRHAGFRSFVYRVTNAHFNIEKFFKASFLNKSS